MIEVCRDPVYNSTSLAGSSFLSRVELAERANTSGDDGCARKH